MIHMIGPDQTKSFLGKFRDARASGVQFVTSPTDSHQTDDFMVISQMWCRYVVYSSLADCVPRDRGMRDGRCLTCHQAQACHGFAVSSMCVPVYCKVCNSTVRNRYHFNRPFPTRISRVRLSLRYHVLV